METKLSRSSPHEIRLMPLATRNVLREVAVFAEPVILVKLVRSYKSEE